MSREADNDVAPKARSRHGVSMISDEMSQRILHAIEHAPDWLRQDLISKDPQVRIRAEETLAAMIAAALRTDPRSS